MAKHKVLLIGVGGFGRVHLNELVRLEDEGLLELGAVSDVRIPENSGQLIAERNIRHYSDYREMLAAEKDASFVIVSTPIQLHAPMSIDAMEAGYHVLLEKPPGAAIQDVDRIADTVRRTGKLCAVNFFAPSSKSRKRIQEIVASGEIGEVRQLKGISLLKRTDAYFKRTPWAGKLTANGVLVMDGAFHNPTAHLLYSMINLSEMISELAGRSAEPSRVTAEMYHANDIESDDTTSMRIEMSDGVELCFYVTLCARETETQRIRIVGTEGAVEWNYDDQVTLYKGNETETFDCSENGIVERRYTNLLRTIDGLDERLDVSLESARHFTLVANGACESTGHIKSISSDYVYRSTEENQPGAYIEGIEATMKSAFEAGKLLSEMNIPWAVATEPFELKGYVSFPQLFRVHGFEK